MNHIYASSDDFFHDLCLLTEAWCDRRCLHALADVLPAFTSINGSTDGWGELAAALKAAFLSKDALTGHERQMVAQLRRAAEDSVHWR
ncbi:hypothetical protein [Sphingomonas sp. TWP1-3-1]|jgi:hypothetical protein|uniref:hypothetical protein n=1 Tax=Sphingomonas sp. TWP1-3-1 TaxID=2804612 RepID=UPI003CF2CC37